jgi:hypothetical protein
MPPEYQPEEDTYPIVWVRVFTGPHRDCGGWWRDRDEPVCACGTVLAEPGKAAA